ncbi:MAG: sulfurtransferase TusA family protein [Agitococcus sp.]|nr:sulfurtransferase TusA family protein [Agitococcus sp.]
MYLDARGLHCPMPLLKLKQALHGLEVGEILTVSTTDAVSQRDFVVFLGQTKHQLLLNEQRGDEFYFEVRKGG